MTLFVTGALQKLSSQDEVASVTSNPVTGVPVGGGPVMRTRKQASEGRVHNPGSASTATDQDGGPGWTPQELGGAHSAHTLTDPWLPASGGALMAQLPGPRTTVTQLLPGWTVSSLAALCPTYLGGGTHTHTHNHTQNCTQPHTQPHPQPHTTTRNHTHNHITSHNHTHNHTHNGTHKHTHNHTQTHTAKPRTSLRLLRALAVESHRCPQALP